MARFVVGDDRNQSTLFPERLEDYLSEDNPVRTIDVFVDELDLAGLGFGGVAPEVGGRLDAEGCGRRLAGPYRTLCARSGAEQNLNRVSAAML